MPLTDSLIEHWNMGGTGNEVGVHAGITLTETSGTIDSVAGKVGNCRDFEVGDTEHFVAADSVSLSTGDIDFTWSCWVNMESKGANRFIICKNASVGQAEFFLVYDNVADRFTWTVSNNGSATIAVTASNLGIPALSTWYFIVVWHDAANNLLGIQVNNGTANTGAHSTGVFDSTSILTIGARGDGALGFDGLIDEASFWKRVLTADEKTALYNGGNGLAYPWASGASLVGGRLVGSGNLIGGRLVA